MDVPSVTLLFILCLTILPATVVWASYILVFHIHAHLLRPPFSERSSLPALNSLYPLASPLALCLWHTFPSTSLPEPRLFSDYSIFPLLTYAMTSFLAVTLHSPSAPLQKCLSLRLLTSFFSLSPPVTYLFITLICFICHLFTYPLGWNEVKGTASHTQNLMWKAIQCNLQSLSAPFVHPILAQTEIKWRKIQAFAVCHTCRFSAASPHDVT